MANIDLFGVTRDAVHSRKAFNVHTTTRHSVQDPFPDQIKATSFILKQKSLKPDKRRKTIDKFNDPRKAKVSSSNIDAYATGKKKIEDNLHQKLFSLYGILNIEEDEDRDSD